MKYALIFTALICSVIALGIFLWPKYPIDTTLSSQTSTLTSLTNLQDGDATQLTYQDKVISLEVARSTTKKEEGLMNRTEMESDHGMIFIFDDEQTREFWMKNTLISLDMIFLDKDLKIVNIASSTKINQTSETYSSDFSAQFVIETNGGWSERNYLQIGNSFQL